MHYPCYALTGSVRMVDTSTTAPGVIRIARQVTKLLLFRLLNWSMFMKRHSMPYGSFPEHAPVFTVIGQKRQGRMTSRKNLLEVRESGFLGGVSPMESPQADGTPVLPG